jgi:hypothetical protein
MLAGFQVASQDAALVSAVNGAGHLTQRDFSQQHVYHKGWDQHRSQAALPKKRSTCRFLGWHVYQWNNFVQLPDATS